MRTVALTQVNEFLDYSMKELSGFFAVAAGADWMCVPLRVQASDNGASGGNFSYLSASKLHLRVMLSG